MGGDALSGHKSLKKKSVSFPDETLDLIRLSAAEHKQNILLEWVNIHLTANRRTQAVDTLAKIRIPTGNIDPLEAGGIIQHRALSAVSGQEQSGLHP